MNKLSADLLKKIYEFSGEKDIKDLCASNISKEMNKIQASQIKKLTKQLIRKKKYAKHFFSIDPNPITNEILSKMSKDKLLDVIYELVPHADGEYSPIDDLLRNMLKEWKIITAKDIDDAIDSFTKKDLCHLWKQIFAEQ